MVLYACSLVCSACLLPPPVIELPAEQNHPPRIEPTSLRWDPTDGPRQMSTHCPGYRFYALVSDPDESDTLYWRVFVDYHRDRTPLESEVHFLDPQPGDRSLSFSVDPQSDTRFGVAEGRLTQAHTVELLVADRPFHTADDRLPLARAVEDDGEIDSFIWTVELLDTIDPDCGVTAVAP